MGACVDQASLAGGDNGWTAAVTCTVTAESQPWPVVDFVSVFTDWGGGVKAWLAL